MEITVVNNQLVIKADMGQGTPSKTGKTLIVATTSGFIPVPNHPELKLSLNVIKSR
jgi:hypothetical protein